MMKKFKLIIFLLVFSVVAQAQDLGKFLEGGVADGNKILENYLEPAFVGFGYAMNSGWYNTGKPHKLLGFDITANVSAAYVPESAQFFTLNPADYTNISTESGSSESGYPTMFGPNLDADEIPYLVFNKGTEDEIKISSPTGLGLDEAYGVNFVPAPSLQLGIGLIKNTELKLRLVPEQSTDDFSTSMFGIGVMHDVKQWIPVIKNLPFDLSAFAGYTQMNNTVIMGQDSNGADQIMEFNCSGMTVQGVISKKLALLTVYGGVGYSTSNLEFNMLGDFEIDGVDPDPVALEFSKGGMRANVGARIKLLILTIHAEYAVQEYNTLTAGVGLSIR